MNQFFIGFSEHNDDKIILTDDNAKHIINVLRLRVGESLQAVNIHDQTTYTCEIETLEKNAVICKIVDMQKESRELPVDITLYQGLPKGDKFEFVIQKAVELGVHEIVPVQMKHSIMKIDPKKVETKQNRWQAIAKSAAEQSKRTYIPEILPVQSFENAIDRAHYEYDFVLVPYENAEGMNETRAIMEGIVRGVESIFEKSDENYEYVCPSKPRIAIFIGPEGGFADSEIELVKDTKAKIISLGKRILRTETAPIAILSWLTYLLER